jgi:hypothetical protein
MPPDKIKVYPEFATLSEELFPSDPQPQPRPTRADALAAVEELKLTAIESTWGGRDLKRIKPLKEAEKNLIDIIEALTGDTP